MIRVTVLYFEPLKEEYVFNIIKKEKEKGNLVGIIAQFGGQTPIKLAKFLHDNKLPILGTQYTSIDLAEDRDLFRNLLDRLKLKQAESGIAKTFKQAIQICRENWFAINGKTLLRIGWKSNGNCS